MVFGDEIGALVDERLPHSRRGLLVDAEDDGFLTGDATLLQEFRDLEFVVEDMLPLDGDIAKASFWPELSTDACNNPHQVIGRVMGASQCPPCSLQ